MNHVFVFDEFLSNKITVRHRIVLKHQPGKSFSITRNEFPRARSPSIINLESFELLRHPEKAKQKFPPPPISQNHYVFLVIIILTTISLKIELGKLFCLLGELWKNVLY